MIDRVTKHYIVLCFFFQAEDGIRDLVRSRGLGDVYKRQNPEAKKLSNKIYHVPQVGISINSSIYKSWTREVFCLLYTSDAADERSSVDLGGRRIIKKKKNIKQGH